MYCQIIRRKNNLIKSYVKLNNLQHNFTTFSPWDKGGSKRILLPGKGTDWSNVFWKATHL